MSLDKDRDNFITASEAHRVMADYELELRGQKMSRPDVQHYEGIRQWIGRTGRIPKVLELKAVGIIATGEEIKQVWRYLKAKIKVFSEAMESVAREMAMNQFIEVKDTGYKSEDMERGDIQEGEAVARLSAYLNVDFKNTTTEQIFLSDGDLGVTPDAIEYSGFTITSCGEVKNPNDDNHMRYLHLIKNQADLLAVRPVYYWQAQCGLAVTGAKIYHWASYHNGFDPEYRLVYVPVVANNEHISMLKQRASRVLKRVPDIVAEIRQDRESRTA